MRRDTNLVRYAKTWQPCMPSFQGVESTTPSGPTADVYQSTAREINFSYDQQRFKILSNSELLDGYSMVELQSNAKQTR
jgi:hypothetical protein